MDATLKVELTEEQKAAAAAQALVDVKEWYDQAAKLAALKDSEMALRNKVVQYYFPNGLKEGTNKAELPEACSLTVTGTINRKVDVAAQQAVAAELKEKFEIDAGELLKYKPEIDLPAYRKLVEDVAIYGEPVPGEAPERGQKREVARAILKTFEQMLIISDGSPQVKLNLPKKPKAKVSAI